MMNDLPPDVVEALATVAEIPARGHLTGPERAAAVAAIGRAYAHGVSIRTIASWTQGRSYGSIWTLLAESGVARRGIADWRRGVA